MEINHSNFKKAKEEHRLQKEIKEEKAKIIGSESHNVDEGIIKYVTVNYPTNPESFIDKVLEGKQSLSTNLDQ